MNAVPTISAHTARDYQPGVLSIWRGFIPASKSGRSEVPATVRDRVLAEVSAETGIPVREIMARLRTGPVFRARAEAIQRLRDMTQANGAPRYSLPAIGRALGRDHASVHNAIFKRDRSGRASA